MASNKVSESSEPPEYSQLLPDKPSDSTSAAEYRDMWKADGPSFAGNSSGMEINESPEIAPLTRPSAPREYMNQWQDAWAAVLFIIQFVVIHIVAIWLAVALPQILADAGSSDSTGRFDSPDSFDSSEPPPESNNESSVGLAQLLPQLGVACVLGPLFVVLWLHLVRRTPETMVHISLWFSVAVAGIFGTTLLASGEDGIVIGFFFLLVAACFAFYAVRVRPRIPFAAAMLKQAVEVICIFPRTVLLSYLGLLVSFWSSGVWSFSIGVVLFQTNSSIVFFLMLIGLFWTTEVIRNVIRVTTAGTVATYYFQRLNMPPNPVGRALKRAVTKSFGSICLGSLIVAFLQAVRNMVANMRARNRGSAIGLVLGACLEFVLLYLELLIRYFNKWAYVQVAVYGKPFIQAAKDTWEMFQRQGFHVVINDDLTDGVLLMGGIVGATATALITAIWTSLIASEFTAMTSVLAFFIGLFMTLNPMTVVQSAVAAYYVCYADDPATLQYTDPEFYAIMHQRQTFLQDQGVELESKASGKLQNPEA